MMKKLKVTVDGKAYDVTVEMLDEAGEAVQAPVVASHAVAATPVARVAPPAPARATPAANTGDIRSPLAGKVVTIAVNPGDQVTEGQQVLTLEAMKMNTYIYAPKSGRVSRVLVKAGDAVDEGASLITIA